MRRRKRGIVLLAVLLVMVALSLLASLALYTAVQEWRVATLAEDRVHARASALTALLFVDRPPSLEALCLSPPLTVQQETAPVGGVGTARIAWRHLGAGTVRAEVTGNGRHGARARLLALLAPDSVERTGGLFRCPAARRLVPLGDRWLEGHPEG